MIAESEVYEIGTITRTHGVKGEVAFQFTDDVWDRVEADYLFLRIDGLLVPFFLEEWRFRSDTVALLKFEDTDSANAAERLVGATVWFPKSLTPTEVDDADLTWRMFTGFQVLIAASQRSEELQPTAAELPHGGEIQITKDSTSIYSNSDSATEGSNSAPSAILHSATEGSNSAAVGSNSAQSAILHSATSGTVTAVDDRTANTLLYITTPDGREVIIPAVEEFIISADHQARTLLADIPEELLTLNN